MGRAVGGGLLALLCTLAACEPATPAPEPFSAEDGWPAGETWRSADGDTADTGAPQALVQAALPGASLVHEPLVAGQPATFVISGVDPSTDVSLLISTTGASTGTCRNGTCVDLDEPINRPATARADATGRAEIVLDIPSAADGRDAWFQGLVTVGGVRGGTNVSATTVGGGGGGSAPSVSDVGLVPAHPVPGDAVSCTWTFQDPDGDADQSTVSWTIDGAVVDDGPTLDVAFGTGDVLGCEVTPFDGTDVGTPVLETVRVPGNLLILLADDFGADQLGSYGIGSEIAPTPNLDALADRGVRFHRAWSNPHCSPTRSTLQTGRHIFRTGVTWSVWPDSEIALPFGEQSIPEMLDAGTSGLYSSSYIGKWNLGSIPTDFFHNPNLHGWDYYAGSLNGVGDGGVTSDGLDQTWWDWERTENGSTSRQSIFLTTGHVNDALARMQAMPEPWVLMVGFYIPHGPAIRPPDHLHSGVPIGDDPDTVNWHYMVEAMDTEIGRLLDGLQGGLDQRTTVVFMGDNGTAGEFMAADRDPRRAKASVYEGGVRIPLLVAGPTVEQPGRTVDALVHTVDLFPTLADLAGAELDPTIVRDGVSFAPYLEDPAQPPLRDTIYTEQMRPLGFGPYWRDDRAVRDDRYKLVARDGNLELYDLGSREWEGTNLLADGVSATEDAIVQRLLDAMPR